MRKRVLRVLHIGVSNRGIWPLKNCTPVTGFAPAALCDVTPTALEQARQLTGLDESACFTDVDRAIAESEVDCVIICTPTILHVPLAKKAIAAGLPVLVEKGMAPDWTGATDLVRTAARKTPSSSLLKITDITAVNRLSAERFKTHPIQRTSATCIC